MSPGPLPSACESARDRLAIEALEGPAVGPPDPQTAAHCATCAACAAVRDEYAEVVGLLAFDLPDAPPSSAVRDRIALRIRPRRPRRTWRWPAIAAVLALVLLAGVAAGAWLDRNAGNGRVDLLAGVAHGDRVALAAAEAGEGSRGELVIDREGGTAFLAAYDLPPLSPGEIYQFWFLRTDGTRVDARTFRPDTDGNALHVVPLPPAFENVRGVWVTVEPGAGSATPQGPNVLIARWK